jgi:hypothetical protein
MIAGESKSRSAQKEEKDGWPRVGGISSQLGEMEGRGNDCKGFNGVRDCILACLESEGLELVVA